MQKRFFVSMLFLFFTLKHTAFSQQRVKVYTLYTPSHTRLLTDYFLPSLKDDVDLDICFCDQAGAGIYLKNDWNTAIIKKVEHIIKAIRENWDGFFIFADADIQFFRPIEKEILASLKNNDIVLQRDDPRGYPCTGFFICRGNEKTLRLWQAILRRLMDVDYMTRYPNAHDQTEFYRFVVKNNPFKISWALLPETFFGGGVFTGKRWNPGDSLFIPEGIYLHHANWTVGVENKIAQLMYVKSCVTELDNVALVD